MQILLLPFLGIDMYIKDVWLTFELPMNWIYQKCQHIDTKVSELLTASTILAPCLYLRKIVIFGIRSCNL